MRNRFACASEITFQWYYALKITNQKITVFYFVRVDVTNSIVFATRRNESCMSGVILEFAVYLIIYQKSPFLRCCHDFSRFINEASMSLSGGVSNRNSEIFSIYGDFFRGKFSATFCNMVNIFTCKCPNRSGVGAVDSPDRFVQVLYQSYIPEVSEKIFTHDISMIRRQKMVIFGVWKVFISNFTYYNLY